MVLCILSKCPLYSLIAALCRALVSSDLNGPLADFLFALLTALHNLQAQEDKAAEQFSSQESTKVPFLVHTRSFSEFILCKCDCPVLLIAKMQCVLLKYS